jgi:hypothetical protein
VLISEVQITADMAIKYKLGEQIFSNLHDVVETAKRGGKEIASFKYSTINSGEAKSDGYIPLPRSDDQARRSETDISKAVIIGMENLEDVIVDIEPQYFDKE